ncbi:hypothetical protein D3C76_1335280 [compost metagenome]
MFFQPRQHFLRKALELHCAFGFVVGHGVGLFLEQLDGVFVSLDLVVGIGRIERFITHIEDFFLGLFHQCRGVRHFNVIFFRDGRQFIIGLGMIGDHHVGERLDIG